MSINPASASEPAMRETDSSSNQRNWSLLQGSRTGSKEGQFSSFWENAVRGAQKLLGLEKTNNQETEPKEEDRTEKDRREDAKMGDGLNTVSGFSGSRFGISLSMGRESMGVLPRFGRIEQSRRETIDTQRPSMSDRSEGLEERAVEPNKRKTESKSKESLERAPSSIERKTKVEDEIGDDEDQRQAKTADRSSSLVRRPITQSSEKLLIPDNQQIKNQSEVVGTETAKLSGVMLNASPNQEKSAVSKQNQSVEPAEQREIASQANKMTIEPVSRPQDKAAPVPVVSSSKAIATPLQANGSQSIKPIVESTTPVQRETTQGESAVAASTKQTSRVDVANAKTEVSVTIPNKDVVVEAKPVAETPKAEASPKVKADGELDLGFDTDKAKANVSTALQRQAKAAQKPSSISHPKVVQAPAGNAEQPTETVTKPLETARVEAPETSNHLVETKSPGQDVGSRMAMARQRRGDAPVNLDQVRSQSTPNASQTAGEHANANSRVANPEKFETLVANSREAPRADVANRNQRVRFSNTTNSQSSGISSVGTNASANGLNQSAGSQSHSENQGSEHAPKQDVAAAIKSAVSNVRSEKGGDLNQSFDVRASSASQSRRSQAAVKAQPTSYASKTVEEVKEVIATLTKSIDRLSATRQDTISVRVSFEHGGSLALKVSMDKGHVNAVMQTDVPGLEGMLKGAWSELVNEVALKGIKLNQPQFSQSESESRNENFASHQQREGRSQSSEANSGRGQGRSEAGNTGSRSASSGTVNSDSSAEAPSPVDNSIISDNELKTYA